MQYFRLNAMFFTVKKGMILKNIGNYLTLSFVVKKWKSVIRVVLALMKHNMLIYNRDLQRFTSRPFRTKNKALALICKCFFICGLPIGLHKQMIKQKSCGLNKKV
jgi:hypothetical protein